MNFFLTAFGLHNPFVDGALPEHGIYPVSASSTDGIDLDYTTLLLGNEYIIDASSLAFIDSGEKSFLAPMARTLGILKREGFLRVEDFGSIVRRHEAVLRSKTDALLADPTGWLHETRQQWQLAKAEFLEFHTSYGASECEILNTAHFGAVNYLLSKDGAVHPVELKRLTNLLLSQKRTHTRAEINDLREMLRPLIAQILINELVRSEIQCPYLDWDDAKGFYDKLYLGRWNEGADGELRQRAKKLFEVVVPGLRPCNIEEVVRFIRDDKAVSSLRAELQTTITTGQAIDEKWFIDYINAAVRRDLTVKKRVRKIRWLGALASVFLPGSGIVTELGVNFAAEGVEGVITDSLEASGTDRYRWYYALQQNCR